MKTNMKELSKFLKWSVAGDGYVGYSTHNKNAHYYIERLAGHKDYLEVIASKFSGLQDCTVCIKEYTRKDNGKAIVSLRTSSHPIFTRIRKRQYIGNHRVIEPHMLTVLDWEALGYLYVDDGSLCSSRNGARIVRISTCAYSYPEQEAIVTAVKKKLGIQLSVNKAGGNRYQLNVLKGSQDKFFDNIRDHIPQSYDYKLP